MAYSDPILAWEIEREHEIKRLQETIIRLKNLWAKTLSENSEYMVNTQHLTRERDKLKGDVVKLVLTGQDNDLVIKELRAEIEKLEGKHTPTWDWRKEHN